MSGLALKKEVLEIVDNQLKADDPPAVREALDALLDEGYSESEAKEKIGAVVLAEIYDSLKENQPYDEIQYAQALDDMVQQCIDFEDDYSILTEWDEWYDLVECGYDIEEKLDYGTLVSYWWEAWGIFKSIIEEEGKKTSVSDLMKEQDYRYPIDGWLQDLEMELWNAGEHEKHVAFCHEVLELLDWSYDDNSCFLSAIGEELYEAGKPEEGRKWFEDWIKRDTQNENALNVFSLCVEKQEGAEKAYEIVREEAMNNTCTVFNSLVFERAKDLAEALQLDEDLKWIKPQLEAFREAEARGDFGDDPDDFFLLQTQQPIVKEKKIYPNDPCPCGSGKKYKKCCGRN